MGQRLAALLVASAVGVSLPASATDQSDGERTFQKAMALFEGHSDETIDLRLVRAEDGTENTAADLMQHAIAAECGRRGRPGGVVERQWTNSCAEKNCST